MNKLASTASPCPEKEAASPWVSKMQSLSPSSLSPRSTPPQSPRFPTPTPLMLLFSGSTNEVRVWDVTPCTEKAEAPWEDLVCLFCFKFAPNLGRVQSLHGDCNLLFLGFQSSRICVMELAAFWSDLFTMKSKSKSIRFLTFDLNRSVVSDPA